MKRGTATRQVAPGSKASPVSNLNPLAAHINAEVARAEENFDSFRSRSANVMGLSVGAISVGVGLLANAASNGKTQLPGETSVLAGIALGLFTVATVLALVIHWPVAVSLSDANALGTFVDSHWDDDEWEKSVAKREVGYLQSLQSRNQRMAWLLAWSLAAQVGALAVTSWLGIVIVAAST